MTIDERRPEQEPQPAGPLRELAARYIGPLVAGTTSAIGMRIIGHEAWGLESGAESALTVCAGAVAGGLYAYLRQQAH